MHVKHGHGSPGGGSLRPPDRRAPARLVMLIGGARLKLDAEAVALLDRASA
jgi:hypothetical protein